MASVKRDETAEEKRIKSPSDAPAQLIALARILARQAVREAITLQKTSITIEQECVPHDAD